MERSEWERTERSERERMLRPTLVLSHKVGNLVHSNFVISKNDFNHTYVIVVLTKVQRVIHF